MKTHMPLTELRRRMKVCGVENSNQLAKRLGYHTSSCWRWLNGKTRIDAGSAALIRRESPEGRK